MHSAAIHWPQATKDTEETGLAAAVGTNNEEVVALAKATPGGLDFASAGNGSVQHMALEMFARAAGVKINHVPYRGGGPAMQAVITGEAIFTVDPIPSALGQIRGGSVRALAIAGPQRVASLQDVPTAAEAGQPLRPVPGSS